VNKWVWIGLGVILLAGGAGLFIAFQRSDFVAGLITTLTMTVATAAWRAFAPRLFKLKTPEEYKVENQRYLRGEDPQGKRREH